MQKLKIFYCFTCVLSQMCMLEKYRGQEKTTEGIFITGYNITSICPDRLKMFTNCKVLHVLNTNLEHIPDGVEHLQSLEVFHYNENKTIGTDEDFARLKGLKKLKVIQLKNNKIKEEQLCLRQASVVESGFVSSIVHTIGIGRLFSYFPFKKHLSKIFEYFAANDNFAALEELNISHNQIKDIPDWIYELKELKILNLDWNKISEITKKIGTFTNLTELCLAKNKILTIPSEICDLKNLTKCDFSCNRINYIPKSFFSLNKLTKANLSNNKIETLSISNNDLINLVKLDIANNNMYSLMIEMKSLPNLTYLDVSFNKLIGFPPFFCFPRTVRYLLLSNNLINVLTQLHLLTKLRELNISHNSLTELPAKIVCLTTLNVLNASFNCLKELPNYFGTLEMLNFLDLEHNKLSALPKSVSGLKKINELHLSNNAFKKIPSEILDLVDLQILHFDGNLLENLIDTDHIAPSNNNEQIEANVCKKTLFSLTKLQKLYFDNNKITKISSDIKLLQNLTSISFQNNEIKTIPEEIGELRMLVILNLKENYLKCLPFSMSTLRNFKLTCLKINNNIIPKNDTKYGLGIDSLIKLKFRGFYYSPQHNFVAFDDVVRDMEKDDLHWNFDELKTIKLPADLSEFSTKISDKQMRKIWRVVLKYFIVSEEIIEEQDSESSDDDTSDSNTDIDDKIFKITGMDAFKDIKANAMKGVKHLGIDEDDNTHLPLYKKISKLLRDNSTPKTENPIVIHKMQELLKNSIKAIFYKFLEKIIEDNSNLENLELIKIAITELCEDKLLTCIDGQLEGLQYYYSMFYSSGNEVSNNSIIDFIRDIIASHKEMAFVDVTNGHGENGVHHISIWRAVFKKLLGIQHSFDDPYANIFSSGYSKYKIGSILNDFLKKFTVDNVIADLLKKINTNMVKLNETVILLKDILKVERPDVDDYTLYMNVIEIFYEYKTIAGYSELQPTKLKKDGLIKILLYLQILKENKALSLL